MPKASICKPEVAWALVLCLIASANLFAPGYDGHHGPEGTTQQDSSNVPREYTSSWTAAPSRPSSSRHRLETTRISLHLAGPDEQDEPLPCAVVERARPKWPYINWQLATPTHQDGSHPVESRSRPLLTTLLDGRAFSCGRLSVCLSMGLPAGLPALLATFCYVRTTTGSHVGARVYRHPSGYAPLRAKVFMIKVLSRFAN